MKSIPFCAALVFLVLNLGDSVARAQQANTPPELAHVGVNEHLDAQVPLDVPFIDETGKRVLLGSEISKDKPTLLIFAYHTCPVLCSMLQNAIVEGLRGVAWSIGRDFNAITLSIDPRDTPARANEKRSTILSAYGRSEANYGWHFLTGNDEDIHKIADTVGFEYHYDDQQHQYAHPAVVTLLKPGGRIARYLYGIEFSPADLRLGLLEASEGRSISTLEKVILYCYHYDPQGGKYVVVANRVMRIGGAIGAVLLAAFLISLWLVERKRSRNSNGSHEPALHSP